LAERSALGQGGNLTQSLADARKTSQAGLENLAGKDYLGQVQATQEANEAARRGVRDRVNVLSGKLDTDVARSAATQSAAQDQQTRTDLSEFVAGTGPQFEAAKLQVGKYLLSQGHQFGTAGFNHAMNSAMGSMKRDARNKIAAFDSGSGFGGKHSSMGGVEAIAGDTGLQARQKALESLAGISEGINIKDRKSFSSNINPWLSAEEQTARAKSGLGSYTQEMADRAASDAAHAAYQKQQSAPTVVEDKWGNKHTVNDPDWMADNSSTAPVSIQDTL
jgi:hypothetical protein